MWPIATRSDLITALMSWVRGMNNSDQVKQHIINRVYALQLTDLLPLSWHRRKDAETLLLEAVERCIKGEQRDANL